MKGYVWIALAVMIVGLVFLILVIKREGVQFVTPTTPTTEIEVIQPPTPKQEERQPTEKEQLTQPPQTEGPKNPDQTLEELGYTNVPAFLEEAKRVLIEKLPKQALARVEFASEGGYFKSTCLDLLKWPKDVPISAPVSVGFFQLSKFHGQTFANLAEAVDFVPSYQPPFQICIVLEPNPFVIYLQPGIYEARVWIGWQYAGETRRGVSWIGQLLPQTTYTFTLALHDDSDPLRSLFQLKVDLPLAVKLLSERLAKPEEVRYLLPSAKSFSNLEHYVKIAITEASKSPKITINSLTMIIREPIEQIVREIFTVRAQEEQRIREIRIQEMVYNITTEIAQMILRYVHECGREVRQVWLLSFCLRRGSE